MNLFFNPNLDVDRIALDAEESRHIKAMRHQDGDVIQITNGRGNCIDGRLTWKKHEAFVEVEQRQTSQNPENISLVMAPTKQHERTEWLLEKAVEMGIAEVFFVHCSNSERPIIRMERLQRVAIAAIKQSQRWHLPILHEIQKFDTLLNSISASTHWLAHCRSEMPRFSISSQMCNGPVTIWIGPEGDFSQREIQMAMEKNVVPISLGSARLRTETAALAALAALQMHRS